MEVRGGGEGLACGVSQLHEALALRLVWQVPTADAATKSGAGDLGLGRARRESTCITYCTHCHIPHILHTSLHTS